MPINLSELRQLNSVDLANWLKPRPVDSTRADMLVEAALDAVEEAVSPRTSLPLTAKSLVLEVAARAYFPSIQQESIGSRAVSYFAPGDPRSGVFLTDDELGRLGVFNPGVGYANMRSPGGAGGGATSVLLEPPDSERVW